MENCRVHEDDVGHRHERGAAGENLGAPAGFQGRELEVPLRVRDKIGEHTLFREVLKHLAKGVAAMTDSEFTFAFYLAERAAERRVVEERVVTEAAWPSGFAQDLSFDS